MLGPSSYKLRLTSSSPRVISIHQWMACYFIPKPCAFLAMNPLKHRQRRDQRQPEEIRQSKPAPGPANRFPCRNFRRQARSTDPLTDNPNDDRNLPVTTENMFCKPFRFATGNVGGHRNFWLPIRRRRTSRRKTPESSQLPGLARVTPYFA